MSDQEQQTSQAAPEGAHLGGDDRAERGAFARGRHAGYSEGVVDGWDHARCAMSEITRQMDDLAVKASAPHRERLLRSETLGQRAQRHAAELERVRGSWPLVPRRVHDLARRTLLNPSSASDSVLVLADALQEIAADLRRRDLASVAADYWRLGCWLTDCAPERAP